MQSDEQANGAGADDGHRRTYTTIFNIIAMHRLSGILAIARRDNFANPKRGILGAGRLLALQFRMADHEGDGANRHYMSLPFTYFKSCDSER